MTDVFVFPPTFEQGLPNSSKYKIFHHVGHYQCRYLILAPEI
ncbi:unnamed protein product [Arabidopsis halleri]